MDSEERKKRSIREVYGGTDECDEVHQLRSRC